MLTNSKPHPDPSPKEREQDLPARYNKSDFLARTIMIKNNSWIY